ncbi:uncharacterized protein [Triticum aestivum]|uniref:uncharacterized protein isoform X2 n=1 Tax=Triticum aestivum TaxID=4565 RepID=UPI001D00C5C0|nr:uncharacterized protein LOC123189425 isoform X2 [Triticum aestivum]
MNPSILVQPPLPSPVHPHPSPAPRALPSSSSPLLSLLFLPALAPPGRRSRWFQILRWSSPWVRRGGWVFKVEVEGRPAAWGGAVSQEPGRGQRRGQEAAGPAVRRGGLEGEGEGGGRPREKEQAGPASSWRMSSCSSSSASSPSVHPITTQLQNWVRMNNAMEVMLIPRVLYVLLSPGDYFEWLCERCLY